MKNIESYNSYSSNANEVMVGNVIDTIYNSHSIAGSFNHLVSETTADMNGLSNVEIGTFMAGDNNLFRLITKDPLKITRVKFEDNDNNFKGTFTTESPFLSDIINISLEKNNNGEFEPYITLVDKIDDENEMIVTISSKDFLENYQLDFINK